VELDIEARRIVGGNAAADIRGNPWAAKYGIIPPDA
jgi:hypothetical protein